MAELKELNRANSGERKIVPARIAHFVIRTLNVRSLVAWYKTVLHADAIFDNGDIAFLTFDKEHHRIAIGRLPDLDQPNHKAAGLDHVAFSYDTMEDLLAHYTRLKGLGIEPFFKVDHGPTTSLYYKDPDGNQVEFQVDNFDTVEEAWAFFRSEAFANNPIGILIDPDELVARLEAGEPGRALLSAGTKPQ